ncbi:hypothetical protein BH11PSE11_BH11PSE11_31990 [soil metagenome]
MYIRSILALWVTGKITFQTAFQAIADRPMVVSGKHNAYVIDRSFG